MIAPSDAERLIGKRVVLTCESEVTYVGVVRDVPAYEEEAGILLRIDEESHISVWCPIMQVKEVVVVPISNDKESAVNKRNAT